MRILFGVPTPWLPHLGATKVFMEVSEELTALGWSCERICLPDLVPQRKGSSILPLYAEALRAYLHEHAARYDIVDYDHVYLPYPRTEFPRDVLFVARSVLLHHHIAHTHFPLRRTVRGTLASVTRGAARRREVDVALEFADRTISEADLVNVSNDDARSELARHGIPPEKIVVLPFGLTQRARKQLGSVPSTPPIQPVVGFVGTFDFRKGAADFPRIVEAITASVPDVRFLLLGTEGLHRGVSQVLAFFPRRLRPKVEVIPRFEPDELPALLARCSVGVFPSYAEGFGFGVLEMLAAAVPVVAYRSPGPPMMLPEELLVPPGDTYAMAAKVAELLGDRGRLAEARLRARERSRAFSWSRIAERTAEVYTAAVERLHGPRPAFQDRHTR
jgi:glycosyltransferase involved in cell wall biosynthesis